MASLTLKQCRVVLLFLSALYSLPGIAAPDYQYQAERYVGSDPRTGDVIWEPVTMPQNLGEHLSDDWNSPVTVWIRFNLSQHRESTLPQALYVPRHNMTVSLYIDDEHIGGTDKAMFGQEPMGWNMPLLVDVPITSESEHLYLRLQSGPSGVLLAPIAIAPRKDLQDRYESKYFIQITTSQIALAICMLMGILSFWIWFYRQDEVLYLRFTLLCLCYSIQSSFGFLEFVPLDLRIWLTLVHVAGEWANYLLVSYVVLALGRNMPRLVNSLFYLACVATVLLCFIPDQWFLTVAYTTLGIGNVITYGFGVWVLYQVFKKPSGEQLWFGVAFVAMFVFTAHDFYGVFLTTPEQYAEGFNLMHLSLPVLAAAFFSHLLNRFVSALDTSEQYNQELQSAAEEKRRIYRDLHDDVGSKLLSIIHQGENKANNALAREALESIREAVYSVNHGNQTLKSYVNNLLEEVQLRLTSAGMMVDIEADLDNDQVLDSEIAYQVTRIVREVVNNILHHSQATFVTAHVKYKAGHFDIEVTDDGVGLSDQPQGNSGLDNIRFRSEQIMAEYQLQGSDEGTVFNLRLPLPQA